MDQQTTMRDFLKVLFRQKAVVLTSFFTVIITVFVGLLLKTPVYEGKVKLMVSAQKQVESPYYRDLLGDRNLEVAIAQSEIVSSNPVIERAVKAVGLFDRPLDYEKNFANSIKLPFIALSVKSTQAQLNKIPEDQRKGYLFRLAVEDLKKNIKVEPIRDTNLFTISVRDYSPVGSAILANVVSRSYLIFDLQQQLAETQLKYGEKHPSSLQLQDSINAMIKNLNGQPLPDVEAIGPASVKIVEQATLPLRPSGIPKSLTFVLAIFMAGFLGIMLAFVFEYMDQSFKSPQDIEGYLNTPYLGAVPAKVKQQQLSYENLADQILLISKDKNLHTLLFATAESSYDSANIVVNLGKVLAGKGYKVLVVDANFRHLIFKNFFNLEKGPGLVDVIEEKVTFEKSVHTAGKNLAVMTAGETQLNPLTLVETNKMHQLLAQAGEKYDLVLIAAPDLKHRDSILLSAQTDGFILVVKEGVSRKQVVLNALAPVIAKKANFLGVIMNNRTYAIPKAIYDIA